MDVYFYFFVMFCFAPSILPSSVELIPLTDNNTSECNLVITERYMR